MTARERGAAARTSGVLLGMGALALVILVAWLLLDGDGRDEAEGTSVAAVDASPDERSLSDDAARTVAALLFADPASDPGTPAPLAAAESPNESEGLGVEWPEGVVEICLSGRVVDVRGAPWPGATVVFVPDTLTATDLVGLPGGKPERGIDPLAGLPRVATDAEGRFRLCGPWQASPGTRVRRWGDLDPSLLITAPGMAWQGHPAAGFNRGSMDLGDLVLAHPGASLRLRVLDEAGAPLAGVAAVPYVSGYQSGADDDPMPPGRMANGLLGVTGEDGRLLSEHHWPSSIRFSLEQDGYESLKQRIVLPLGERIDLGDVVLTGGWSLRGTVRDAQGALVVGAELMAVSSDLAQRFPAGASEIVDVTGLLLSRCEHSPLRTLSDAEGRFVLGGLPSTMESVSLLCRASGFGVAHRDGLLPGDGDLELVLSPEAGLLVDVRSAATGETLVDAEVRAESRTGYPEDEFPAFLRDPFLPLEVTETRVHRAGHRGTVLFVSAPGHVGQRIDAPPCAPGETRKLVVELEPAAPVTGVVVDAQGAPIEGARVMLAARSGLFDKLLGLREQLTDAAGRFAFEPLAGSLWSGSVEKAGYLAADLELADDRAAGGELRAVLTRTARVTGRLRDARGDPAVAHWVEATPEGELLERHLSPVPARTDRTGAFVLPDVDPGTWVIRSEPGAEARVSLESGQEIDLQLQLSPTLQLRGRVHSGAEPLPQVKVAANREDTGPAGSLAGSVSTRTGVDGRFTLELPEPGGYIVRFMAREGPWIARTFTVLEGDAKDLDVDFGTGSLSGRLVAGMHGVALPAQLSLRLRAGEAHAGHVEADASGHFTFGPLPAGSYTINTSPYGYLPMTLGPFELAPGASIEGVEFVLQPAARVTGFAHHDDGEPFEGFAHLRRTDGTPGYQVRGVDDGEFDFDAVEPGAWRLDLATVSGEVLGHGEGLLGQPGAELPLVATERRFELTGGQTERVEILAQRVEEH